VKKTLAIASAVTSNLAEIGAGVACAAALHAIGQIKKSFVVELFIKVGLPIVPSAAVTGALVGYSLMRAAFKLRDAQTRAVAVATAQRLAGTVIPFKKAM